MIPPPPRSTLFPYTTLFRSSLAIPFYERAASEGEKIKPSSRVASSGFADACTASAKDRKSTRLNSSHVAISYAVFCLKKKKNRKQVYVGKLDQHSIRNQSYH